MAVDKYNTQENYTDDIDFIKDSDPVQGDPAGTDPVITPLTGPINIIIQQLIGSLVYLKNAVDNFSISRMTESVFGIGRTATKSEAEEGTEHGPGGPLLTPERGMQLLRGTQAAATDSLRGTVRRATQAKVNAGEEQDEYVTPETLKGFYDLRSGSVNVTASSLTNILSPIVNGYIISDDLVLVTCRYTANSDGIASTPRGCTLSVSNKTITELILTLRNYQGAGRTEFDTNGGSGLGQLSLSSGSVSFSYNDLPNAIGHVAFLAKVS